MKNIRFISWFFSIFILIGILLIFNNLKSVEKQEISMSPNAEEQNNLLNLTSSGKQVSKSVRVEEQSETSEIRSEKELQSWLTYGQEVVEWRRENFGYSFSDDDIVIDYQDYDFNILESLSEQGDFIAMHVLAGKYSAALKMDDAIRLYNVAAAYGSTVALKSLATLTEKISDDPIIQRQEQIKRLAYYQTAILRGDESFVIYADIELKNKNIELTEDEKKTVQRYGKELFENILGKRRKLGLPEFDYTIPDYIKLYNEENLGNSYSHYFQGESALFLKGL